jgi:hypothetical protein
MLHSTKSFAVHLGALAAVVSGLWLSPAAAEAALLLSPSGSDTVVFASGEDDEASAPVSIGFGFEFYGTSQSQVYINTNGSLTFGAGDPFTTFDTFPGAVAPNTVRIAPFLDDLVVSAGGDIRYNNSQAGVFAVTWNNLGIVDQSDNSVSAQALLLGSGNPYGFAAGTILFSYGTVSDASAFLSAGLDAGDSSAVAVLPFADDNGVFSRTQALGLQDRLFAFTPSGNGYAVTEIPEPASTAGVAALALGGLLVRHRRLGRG